MRRYKPALEDLYSELEERQAAVLQALRDAKPGTILEGVVQVATAGSSKASLPSKHMMPSWCFCLKKRLLHGMQTLSVAALTASLPERDRISSPQQADEVPVEDFVLLLTCIFHSKGTACYSRDVKHF